MFLLYVDECGDNSLAPNPTGNGLKDGVSEFFTLSAVGIRDSSRGAIARDLVKIKRKWLGLETSDELAGWSATEIKGRHLARAARSVAAGMRLPRPLGFSLLTNQEEVEGLLRDLGLIFTPYRPMTFSVTVDKREHRKRSDAFDPVGVAYAYLHQRVALTLEHLYEGESAIFIADQQVSHERYFHSGDMNTVRRTLSRSVGDHKFELILDQPLWVDTELSSWDRELIQLADVVAYSATECVRSGSAPAYASFLWPQIRSKLAMHWRTGSPEGRGFAVHPPTAAMPDLG